MTLPDPLDDDEVILYVADWLLRVQKVPSMTTLVEGGVEEPVCAYRGGDTKDGKPCSCGLGCLVPDDEYDPSMEGLGITITDDPVPANPISALFVEKGYYLPLLAKLQTVHDLALDCEPSGILKLWWQSLVRMTFALPRDRERSPCRDKDSRNADTHKDAAYKILMWFKEIPGLTEEDVRLLADDCQRHR